MEVGDERRVEEVVQTQGVRMVEVGSDGMEEDVEVVQVGEAGQAEALTTVAGVERSLVTEEVVSRSLDPAAWVAALAAVVVPSIQAPT